MIATNLAESCTSTPDLRHVDLRGKDLRGADLSTARHLALAELVAIEGGEWKPLAAWDAHTRFPPDLADLLWMLGMLDPCHLSDPEWRGEAIARGEAARHDHPIDKSRPGILEVEPGWWADG